MIIIDNKKLHNYIIDKDKLVEVGRGISRQIETLDIKIKRFEEKEKRITAKVDVPKELTDEGEKKIKEVNKLNKEIVELADRIKQIKLAAIPKDIEDAHKTLMKEKEKLETERNKIALKVQKIKDMIIPIVQKEVKPKLQDRFDDIETAKAKDGKVVITTFNHLEDFKAKFR